MQWKEVQDDAKVYGLGKQKGELSPTETDDAYKMPESGARGGDKSSGLDELNVRFLSDIQVETKPGNGSRSMTLRSKVWMARHTRMLTAARRPGGAPGEWQRHRGGQEEADLGADPNKHVRSWDGRWSEAQKRKQVF